MHHRYEAASQLLLEKMNDMTYSVDLILSVLVYPKSSIDTPHTTSSIPICRLGRMRWDMRYDLGIEVIQDLIIGKPNKVPSKYLAISFHAQGDWQFDIPMLWQ